MICGWDKRVSSATFLHSFFRVWAGLYYVVSLQVVWLIKKGWDLVDDFPGLESVVVFFGALALSVDDRNEKWRPAGNWLSYGTKLRLYLYVSLDTKWIMKRIFRVVNYYNKTITSHTTNILPWRFGLYQRPSSEEACSVLPVLATIERWCGKKSVVCVS